MNAPDARDKALSPEQVRIIELIARGGTDQGIARELGLSERSVRRRVRSTAETLGASSRAALVLRAAELGLIRSPSHNDSGRKRPPLP